MANESTGTVVRYLGTTDEVTTCDCCGRSELKSTVALSIDDADPVHFGVVCAARALRSRGIATDAKAVRKATVAADRAKQDARLAVLAAEREAAWMAAQARAERFDAWLAEVAPIRDWSGKFDRFAQLKSLGGYEAARARYSATVSS